MAEIRLSGASGLVAFVDEQDLARCLERRWFPIKRRHTTYVFANVPRDGKRRTTELLHRFVMQAPAGILVDHRDGNGLDCRRTNLRLATSPQNAANMRRKPRGITPSGYGGWVARIRHEGRNLYLGTFPTENEAEAAYVAAGLDLKGEFVCR